MSGKDLFHIESLNSLYTDVQSQEIFPDSKFFVDCTPTSSPAAIAAEYEKVRGKPGFSLQSFVAKHFIFPSSILTGYQSAHKSLITHIEDLWDVLQRKQEEAIGTLIPLPYAYIVPGGRFRELYYWDSYFTLLGLQVSGRTDIIQNMVDNFAYLLDQFGFIPNANRTYYLGRSQPPFFVLMVLLLSEEKGDDILLKYLPQLEKEYRFWMSGEENLTAAGDAHRRAVKMPDGSIMNRYWDDNNTPRPEAYREDRHVAAQSSLPAEVVYRHIRAAAESGWDFTCRWFKDGKQMSTIHTTDLIPVDLNCVLLQLEETLCRAYVLQHKASDAALFNNKVVQRKKSIQTYCWNNDTGFYFDYNHVDKKQSGLYTLAAVFPLFFRVAEKEHAESVAAIIQEKFLFPGGLVTTLYNSPQQWDAPNGWAPLQWMAYKGLMQYGHHELAGKIKQHWMENNEKIYDATGKMMEKYNVMDTSVNAGGGEYPNQDGFGWTNGVYLKMREEN